MLFRKSTGMRQRRRLRFGGETLEHRILMTGDVAMEELVLAVEDIDLSRVEDAYFVKVDAETTTENGDTGTSSQAGEDYSIENTDAAMSDPEWKYVPVRRYF